MSDEETHICIRTQYDETSGPGTYRVTLEAGPDVAIGLGPHEVLRFASTLLSARARAIHDAAVAHQFHVVLNVPLEDVSRILFELRKDRPPLKAKDTRPLTFEPGVNKELQPFITILLNGAPLGQWDMEDVMRNALGLLEAVAYADLDSAYLRHLVANLGIEKPRALAVVEDLGTFVGKF